MNEAATVQPRPQARLRSRLSWSIVSSLGGLLVSAVSMLMISRLVPAAEYGRVAVTISKWALFLNAITWCGGLVIRFGPVELQSSDSLGETISARAVFALPVLPFILLVAPAWLYFVRGWPSLFVVLTILWLAASTVYDFVQWSAVAAQSFRALSIATAVTRGSAIPLLAFTLATGVPLRAEGLLWSMAVAVTLGAAILLFAVRRYVRLRRPDRALLRKMWRYSLPGLIGMPALAAIASVDPIILDRYVSRADVGRYQLAATTITIFAAVGISFNSVFSPDLVRAVARHDEAAVALFVRRHQPLVSVALALGAFALAGIAPFIVRLVVGPDFAPMGRAVALLAIAGGYLLALYTLLPAVNAIDAVWSQQSANLIQGVLNVSLDLVLAPRYGLVGVGIANIVAWGANYLLLSVLLRRFLPISLWPLFVLAGTGAAVSWVVVVCPAAVVLSVSFVLLVAASLLMLHAWRLRRALA